MENESPQQDLETKTAINLSSMRKMPEVPDMSGKLVSPRRDSPFALSDWGSPSASNTTKP
jgi:hypothetical protein